MMEEKITCPNCGSRVRPNARFCSHCGAIYKSTQKELKIDKEIKNETPKVSKSDTINVFKYVIKFIVKYVLKMIILSIFLWAANMLNDFSLVVIIGFPVLALVLFTFNSLLKYSSFRKTSTKIWIALFEKFVIDFSILIGIVNYFEINNVENISDLLINSTIYFFLLDMIFSIIGIICCSSKTKTRQMNFWYAYIVKTIIFSIILYIDLNVINVVKIISIPIYFFFNLFTYLDEKLTIKRKVYYMLSELLFLNIPYLIVSSLIVTGEYSGSYVDNVIGEFITFGLTNLITGFMYILGTLDDSKTNKSNKKKYNTTYSPNYNYTPKDYNNNNNSNSKKDDDYEKSEYHHYKTEVRCRVTKSYETTMFSREVVDIDVTAYYYFENGYGQKTEKSTTFSLRECDPRNYDYDALKYAESIHFSYMMKSFR